MARVDIYDPKWIDMVFTGRNTSYGAYQIRKETSSRNMKSLGILLAAAALFGGALAYNYSHKEEIIDVDGFGAGSHIIEYNHRDAPKKVQPKTQKVKEVPVVRQTQKFVAPIIKPDDLVDEKKLMTQMADLDKTVAVGSENVEGTTDRTIAAMHDEIVTAAPPAPEPKRPEITEALTIAEVMPAFPGGTSALMSYLGKNTKYPVVAQENGIEGRVVIGFVVERDGSITDVRILRAADPSLDKEALRVVRNMPRWLPGKQNGQAVRVRFNVPVVFRLN